MTKNDFKVGQKVFLKKIDSRYLSEDEIKIEEGYVSKITNTYIYVKPNNRLETSVKFEISNRFRQEVNYGSANWQLLLDVSQLEEEKEAQRYIAKINGILIGYSKNDSDLSMDKLKKIYDIIVSED